MSDSHLAIAISVAVPLRILELQAQGGPSQEQLNRLPEISRNLSEHGDALLYQSKKQGETARLFNDMALAIAILAFAPGGVTIFGRHYQV